MCDIFQLDYPRDPLEVYDYRGRMNLKKLNWSILPVAAICVILFANACSINKTVTNTATVTVSQTNAPIITISGPVTINIVNNSFQPSMMTAKVGTIVTFYNMMGRITLVGYTGFGMTSFGGIMMQTGNSYKYIFDSPGVYVVSASGQSFQCTITVVS